MSANSSVGGEHHHAHHYQNQEHEYQTSKQGTWLFLCTEILMFGGLFVAYSLFHSLYPELFKEGASHLDWRLGAANTIVLLFSSLTMALGIYFIQVKKTSTASLMLIITLICGFIFMGIKGVEYTSKFHHHMYPGRFYAGEIGEVKNIALYFSFYFMMTGLHALHVLIGMGLITWVLIRNIRGDFTPGYFMPVELVGLFWHLVDLVWIYLFPLLYLVG